MQCFNYLPFWKLSKKTKLWKWCTPSPTKIPGCSPLIGSPGIEGKQITPIFRPTTNDVKIHHYFVRQHHFSFGFLKIILFEILVSSCCLWWFKILNPVFFVLKSTSYEWTVGKNNSWNFIITQLNPTKILIFKSVS